MQQTTVLEIGGSARMLSPRLIIVFSLTFRSKMKSKVGKERRNIGLAWPRNMDRTTWMWLIWKKGRIFLLTEAKLNRIQFRLVFIFSYITQSNQKKCHNFNDFHSLTKVLSFKRNKHYDCDDRKRQQRRRKGSPHRFEHMFSPDCQMRINSL